MISLIVTVLNEGDSIRPLLDSIKGQTRQPDEIVIVDGGSADNTVNVIQSYRADLPIRLLIEPGCNISQGRNHAIAAAQGDIIAVTDAGVRLDKNWLQKISAPLLADPALHVVGGFFLADPQTPFEVALGATTLPLAREIDAATFLPSSRSIAFRKAAAEKAGLYPVWLDYCEDLIFDLRLRAAGPFAFAPEALVHFRPRPSLRAFFRQYYLYARGDGKADLWRKRHLIRYCVYFLLTPAILAAGILIDYSFWTLYFMGALVYLYLPYRRLPSILRNSERPPLREWLCICLLIPVLRLAGDAAKMLGYPAGWRWRIRQRPPDWRKAA